MKPTGRTKEGKATVRVHVQPRSAKNRFCGIHADAIKLAVTAPPVDGKANKAVAKFLAELFGVGQSSVILVSGPQSRKKTFCFETLAESELNTRLRLLIEKH